MKRIAIFASGNGSNAENICNYFSSSGGVSVVVLYTNKEDSYVIERMKTLEIPVVVFSKSDMINSLEIDISLSEKKIDFIVLSGFLLKIPERIILNYKNKIINLHPSLLPKYGGKGMYGNNVHRSVIENNESESGISIHFVNANYDEGDIIFQKICKLEQNETSESLSKKIHQLEHSFFPKIIEKIILK